MADPERAGWRERAGASFGRLATRLWRAGGGGRSALAWSLSLLVVALYLMLPGGDDSAPERTPRGDDSEEPERLEIEHVSPLEPYPGSSIIVTYAGLRGEPPLVVLAGKRELPVLARRQGEIVARLPGELEPGDLKIRVAVKDAKPLELRHARSKPFHVRVKEPNWRKVFRSLLGGAALIAFGIGLMARGVRASTGLHAARAMTRTAQRPGVAYGLGTLTGALAQSTTGAAGILAALVSSSVLPVTPAALAFLGAQLGATVAPLLVTGLVEPREGLVAVTIGILWLTLAADRRAAAIGRLLLGAGFVAFGLQIFRPGLEPFLSDPALLSVTEQLRADNPLDVAACALLGTALVAALQGPAPLVVLIVGVAQTTGRWDLTTALALLSGTGLGAGIAALLTMSWTSPAPASRRLALLHLWLGAASTLLCAATAALFSRSAELVFGEHERSLHWSQRAELSELGTPLAFGFVLSQLVSALVLSQLVGRLAGWLERRAARGPRTEPASGAMRPALAHVLGLQQAALASTSLLAETGARSFGHRAEHALADARRALDALLGGSLRALTRAEGEGGPLGSAAFACLQLQGSLETLLFQAERVTDARIDAADQGTLALPWDDELVLRELHQLVAQGLEATQASLVANEPVDLDLARVREIEINRLEAHARGVLLQPEQPERALERHLHVLKVIDAYEVVGNQVYRLAEALAESCSVPSIRQVS